MAEGTGLDVPRVIGRHDGGRPGPLFLVVGGLHGNEPAGVLAARRVLAELARGRIGLRGRVVALAGNRAALGHRRRFLARDLNRLWLEEELAALRARSPTEDDPEGGEQRELLAIIEQETSSWPDRTILIDLHSTSAGGAPFSIAADTLQNRPITQALPIPSILGLEERIDGPLLSWFADRGHVAVVVEGGQHEAPRTTDHLEAAVWLALEGGQGLDGRDAAVLEDARELLGRAAGGLPACVEVFHPHPLTQGDGFRMLPGFENFQRVREGQPLASQHRGPIRAPRPGYILMPLYQGQGTDGFFLGREVPASWLRFSQHCRLGGDAALLPSLPGVKADPGRPGALLVEGDAWPVVLSILRLFGFRKRRRSGDRILYLRREQGVDDPRVGATCRKSTSPVACASASRPWPQRSAPG